MSRNTPIRIKFLIAGVLIMGALIISTSNECLSAAGYEEKYTVKVTYNDCAGSRNQSRTESWTDKKGKTVYTEMRGCDGKTSTTGTKPIHGGTGVDVMDRAAELSNVTNVAFARALATVYPPIVVVDSTDYDEESRIRTDWLEFNFPFDWVVTEQVAETKFSQTRGDITVSSTLPVWIQIVKLSSGERLTSRILLTKESNYSYRFNTEGLAFGCNYSVVVEQEFRELEDVIIIENHNFCRLP